MDGGAWWAAVHGVARSQTGLSDFTFTFKHWRRKVKSESEVVQSCLSLSDPMDSSLPGFSVHEIFQARILEQVAIAFSMNRSLVFLILLFSSISLHRSLKKAFLSLLAILWNSAFKWVYLSFSPLLFTSLRIG